MSIQEKKEKKNVLFSSSHFGYGRKTRFQGQQIILLQVSSSPESPVMGSFQGAVSRVSLRQQLASLGGKGKRVRELFRFIVRVRGGEGWDGRCGKASA